jgi:hypothetical protein
VRFYQRFPIAHDRANSAILSVTVELNDDLKPVLLLCSVRSVLTRVRNALTRRASPWLSWLSLTRRSATTPVLTSPVLLCSGAVAGASEALH